MRLRQFTSLAALLALASITLAIETRPEPVAADGTRAVVDLPGNQHMRNTGGIDRFGRPGNGAGLCVFTSCEVAESRWQNTPALAGFQKWMTSKPGGGDPNKLAAMIKQYCKEKKVAEPDYIQHTGGDVSVLDLAIKTGRMPCVTYAGMDDFYRGGIDHMVDLAHIDESHAAIIDNNRPGNWVWMTRAEFVSRWKARGGGWAVVFLSPPAPPKVDVPVSLRGMDDCICDPECKCKPGTCPSKCPVLHQWRQQPSCPNGNCPLAAQPAPVERPRLLPIIGADVKWVDRSASSVYVARDMGNGVRECGTGTVIASGKGYSLILTNAHVAEDATRPLAVEMGRKSYPAKYLAGSKVVHVSDNTIRVDGPDLALLSINVQMPAVPMGTEVAPTGTPVGQWGYGGRTAVRGPQFKSGEVIASNEFAKPVQRSTIKSQSGDSGSGVFDRSGKLVGVCWGGDGNTEFAVRLDEVKKFVAPHIQKLKEVAPAPREVVPEMENHGINIGELERHTADGRHRYWINGHPAGRTEALDAVAASPGLVDDSDRYHLSIVTADATAAKAVLSDPKLSAALAKCHVQVYGPSDWPAKDRLGAAVTLQAPRIKGGKVLWTGDKVDGATLADGLKLVGGIAPVVPQPVAPVMPDPVKPAPQPVPAAPDVKQPDPAKVPAPVQPDAPASSPLGWLVAGVLGLLLLSRKKAN